MNIAVRTPDRFIAVDGLDIRYLEVGNGVPAILLHGSSLGSSADVFRRNLPALASGGVRAIAVDLPGFGKSDPAPDLSGAARNAFILRFLDKPTGIVQLILGHHAQTVNRDGRLAARQVLADGLVGPFSADVALGQRGENCWHG